MRHARSNLLFSLEMRSICKRKKKRKINYVLKKNRSSSPRWCYASCRGELGDLICCCYCCYHAKLQVARGNWRHQQQCASAFFCVMNNEFCPLCDNLFPCAGSTLSSSLHCPTQTQARMCVCICVCKISMSNTRSRDACWVWVLVSACLGAACDLSKLSPQLEHSAE